MQRDPLQALFMQAPVPICVLRGSDLVHEMANEAYCRLCGERDILGKGLFETFPSFRSEGFEAHLRSALERSASFVAKEQLVPLERNAAGTFEETYWNFVYAALRVPDGGNRIMGFCCNVTDQVISRRRLEASEARFRQLMSQVDAGIAETDLTGRFTSVNEGYCKIVGRSAAELAQLRVQDITHPEDRPSSSEQFAELVEHGTAFAIEKRYLKPDGSLVWVLSSVSRIDDDHGNPQGVAFVSIDITKTKFDEHAFRANEERFREFVEQVKDYAIFRTDPEGRALTWNQGVKHVLGFDERDFVGQDIGKAIFLPEDVERGVPELELAIAAKEGTANDDRWLRRKNGKPFAAAGATSAVRDAKGQLLGFTKVIRDQTQQVSNEETAARLAAIVTSSDDAIFSKDLQSIIRTWNSGAERIFGYSAEEAIGQPVTMLIPKDMPDEESAIWERIRRGEKVDHYETVRQRKDGSLFDISLTVSPLLDGEGRVIGAASVARDVTERKRVESAVRESEARFRTIFESAEISILEADLSALQRFLENLRKEHRPGLRSYLEANPAIMAEALGLVRVCDVNPATLRMFQASSKEELIRSFPTIFPPETRAVFLEELLALTQGKRLFSTETALRTLRNQPIDVLLRMSVPSDHTPTDRVLVTSIDISARKTAELERESRLAEMERAVRFSEMFVGILSHDLRNPLSAISMAANILSRGAETEKIAKPVSRILTSADRMERMISQLLDLTRIRLGRGIPLERTKVDLVEVCRVVVGELETATGCNVQSEKTGDTSGSWDRDRLAQLVSNLVANASQHGEPGSPIRLRVNGTEPDRVRLEVENRGVIPPDLLPVIFEPLSYRSEAKDERRAQRSSGLGLGLFITQQITHAHGGEIRVESDESRGTRFIVELPRDGRADNTA